MWVGLKWIYQEKLSLADAYIVATTKMLRVILITTDPQLAELRLVKTRLLPIPGLIPVRCLQQKEWEFKKKAK